MAQQTLTRGTVKRRTRLPRRLALLMRPELPSLAQEIIDEVRRSIPEYGRPLKGPYVEALRIGVERALTDFVDRVANPLAPRERHHETYRRLGRFEAQEGRTLDTLQAALRIGAQVAWRRIMKVGPRRRVSPEVMAQLADALFAYIDELAALALEGYLDARPDGEAEAHRRRLLELLLRPAASPRVLAEAAEKAGWTIPDEVTVVVAPPGARYVRAALDEDVLADLTATQPFLVVPGKATRERRRSLLRVLPDGQLVIGLTVPPSGVVDSLRWARCALRLVEDGVLGDTPVTDCEEHLITLWLLSDQALIDQLAARHLGDMDDLTCRQRERLLETLRAWLTTRGSANDIAAELGIHPQTVRYRMRQVESTLGDRLADSDARFAIEAVLRAMRLRERAGAAAGGASRRDGDAPRKPSPDDNRSFTDRRNMSN
ncbi:helix-turn-helix domain-containing protein [Actinomadura geliboluensis]|uniref:PucR family transcriptional regulator n=1 Tax=Actinomadura geliboluensis TaxID=882440 RepID=A0A5S4H8Z6_9ACTN|nr:helix-turn-helix domain-containing protein [Actinomadura geliboluensis]TMR41469.1 PucR family transcriptional regulator [Actinomadura geliboluensis]